MAATAWLSKPEVWIADPGRAYLPPGLGMRSPSYDVPTSHESWRIPPCAKRPCIDCWLPPDPGRACSCCSCWQGVPAPRSPATPRWRVAPGPQRWAAVLVAGDDGSIPVFDNATGAMAELVGAGRGSRRRTSTASARRAGRARHSRMSRLPPGPGCWMPWRTLHPAARPGLPCVHHVARRAWRGRLPRSRGTEFIPPEDLDTALQAGCGSAPTVAIVSACYTGGFRSAAGGAGQPDRADGLGRRPSVVRLRRRAAIHLLRPVRARQPRTRPDAARLARRSLPRTPTNA